MKSKYQISFIKNFLQYKSEFKLSQEQIAALLGVDQGTVSNWLNGKSQPNITQAASIAELFKTSPNELIEYEENKLL